MGYFKQRRSRMREQRAFEAAFPEDVDFDALAWAFAREVPQEERPSVAEPYIRFAVRVRGLPEAAYRGIFQTAYSLRDAGSNPSDQPQLEELITWFEEHLTPHNPHARRAIFWFLADAKECLDRAWQLVRILERAGFKIVMLCQWSVGMVVYRDAHQVAALPERPSP